MTHKKLLQYTAKCLLSAITRDGTSISPITGKNFRDCVTLDGNTVIFWYNCKDHSTHIVKIEVQNA
jgi:hypothetical protein